MIIGLPTKTENQDQIYQSSENQRTNLRRSWRTVGHRVELVRSGRWCSSSSCLCVSRSPLRFACVLLYLSDLSFLLGAAAPPLFFCHLSSLFSRCVSIFSFLYLAWISLRLCRLALVSNALCVSPSDALYFLLALWCYLRRHPSVLFFVRKTLPLFALSISIYTQIRGDRLAVLPQKDGRIVELVPISRGRVCRSHLRIEYLTPFAIGYRWERKTRAWRWRGDAESFFFFFPIILIFFFLFSFCFLFVLFTMGWSGVWAWFVDLQIVLG